MMFIIKSNVKITLFYSKHLKKYKTIGCYCYSIDFKHGKLILLYTVFGIFFLKEYYSMSFLYIFNIFRRKSNITQTI